MRRLAIFAYGIAVYLLSLAVFGSMAGFILGAAVPKGINDPATVPLGNPALAISLNLALVALFGGLHSLLARDRVKAWLGQRLPSAAERSTYVLQSSLCLILAMWLWQPMTTPIWQVTGLAAGLVYAVFALGVGIVLWSTFLIDHFELFGLRQSWSHWRDRPMPAPEFRTPALYRVVRHLLQLGILIQLWATPAMTTGQLLFAGSMTLYIFVGLAFEERALLRSFGTRYRAYQAEVPMLLPLPKRRGER